jgi:hypothetical protein
VIEIKRLTCTIIITYVLSATVFVSRKKKARPPRSKMRMELIIVTFVIALFISPAASPVETALLTSPRVVKTETRNSPMIPH